MPRKHLLGMIMIAVLLAPPVVYAQEHAIKEYTVKKGDTLWDISREELHDPFLWPKIWKENPGITDPDRLSPGQTIRIPLYVLQPEREERQALEKATEPAKPAETKTQTPVVREPSPLVNRDLYVSSGYIAQSINSSGVVAGSPSGRNLFGDGDDIYLETNAPASIGEKFYIVRLGQMVIHPLTHNKVGYIVEVRGTVEVTSLRFGETRAKIAKAYGDVVTGDLLIDFSEPHPPLSSDSYRRPELDGVVLASRGLNVFNSLFDIVYLDKGKEDGVEEGDLFETIFVGEHHIPTGVVQVINAGAASSTAVVIRNTEANDPISAGNLFTHLE